VSKPPIIPPGSWPRRMSAAVAAGYCGEDSVEAFMKRVGNEYPHPRVNDGRHKLWLRDDLDRAILPITENQNMTTPKRPHRRHGLDLRLRIDNRLTAAVEQFERTRSPIPSFPGAIKMLLYRGLATVRQAASPPPQQASSR
jgi:hypothetical protein